MARQDFHMQYFVCCSCGECGVVVHKSLLVCGLERWPKFGQLT